MLIPFSPNTVLCVFCRSGEKITVTPSSKELLFYPPYVETVVSGGKSKSSLKEIDF